MLATTPAHQFTTAGSYVYFTEDRTALWRTDGTPAGTFRLNTWTPGGNISLSSPTKLTDVNGTLFFVLNEYGHGPQLWKSDGTTNGTVMVKNYPVGIPEMFNSTDTLIPWAVYKNKLYFVTIRFGPAIWVSDGTDAGTHIVKDIIPLNASKTAVPSGLTLVNGRLIYADSDTITGLEPWVTDGTADGTHVLKDIYNVSLNALPRFMMNVGGTNFFFADPGTSGTRQYLYKTDGTDAGTTLIAQVMPGVNITSSNRFEATDGRLLYFTGRPADGGNATLWRSDGTPAGTYPLNTINGFVTHDDPDPIDMEMMDGICYFIAEGQDHYQLFRSDGTPEGTYAVTDASSGIVEFPRDPNLVATDNRLFFIARDATHGYEVWTSDGTAGGTRMLKDVDTSNTSVPAGLTAWNGVVYYNQFDPAVGYELFVTDGTTAGTHLLKDIFINGNGNPGAFTAAGDYLYFDSYSDGVGQELWRTDGTAAGTILLLDKVPGPASGSPTNLIPVGDKLLFNYQSTNGFWISDGTPAGTTPLWSGAGLPTKMIFPVNVDGKVFFFGQGVSDPLWETDGTLAGTHPDGDLPPPAYLTGFNFSIGADANGTLYFPYNDGITGAELWMLPNAVPPTVPSGLTEDASNNLISNASPIRSVAGGNSITVTWSHGSDMNGYLLQRSTSPDFAVIDATFKVGANLSEFTDTTVLPGVAYYYRLAAYNPAGQSAPALTLPLINVPANANVLLASPGLLLGLSLQANAAAGFGLGDGNIISTAAISLDTGARLDLRRGGLIFRSTAVGRDADVSRLLGLLKSGRGDANFWRNAGIGSTDAGLANDSGLPMSINLMLNVDGAGNPIRSQFFGQSVDQNSILLRFTYAADFNLDGMVDADDVSAFLADFGAPLGAYGGGDLNFDGQLDADDVSLLIAGFSAFSQNGAISDAPAQPLSAPVLGTSADLAPSASSGGQKVLQNQVAFSGAPIAAASAKADNDAPVWA